MVDHCDSGCCATWFAGWEKTLESAETIPTAQEMPISHRASFISAPTWRASCRATDLSCDAGKQGSSRDTLFLIWAHCKEAALVSRFRSSQGFAATSGAN